MRIAMLTNNYKPFVGGVPVSIERLAAGLRDIGHEVYIFAPDYGQEEKDPYVIRYRTRKKKLKEFVIPDVFDPIIDEVFARTEFDIIHVHHPMLMGYVARHLGKKYDIPVAFTYHTRYDQYLHYIKMYEKLQKYCDNLKGNTLKLFEKKLISQGGKSIVMLHNRIFSNRCSIVFAPTLSMKQFIKKHGTTTEVEIIPTGLINEDFQFDLGEACAIRDSYLSGRKYLFCTVSRLEPEKNLTFLLAGLSRLRKNRGDCFKLMLIGEGSERYKLKELSRRLGIEENIIFCGCIPHEELSNYYRACDLFLFTSQSETQGIVLLEAMAAGLPVVAVEGMGIRDVVNNGVNGYMTEKKVTAWEEKIEFILDYPELSLKMKEEAVKEAKCYNASRIARKAEQCYLNTLMRYGRKAYR